MWYALRNAIDPDKGAPLSKKKLTTEIASVVMASLYRAGHQLGWILVYLAAEDEIVKRLLEQFRDHGLFGPHSEDVVDTEILE